MPYQFKHHGQHHCEAVVLSCIDFRFWSHIVEHIKNEFNISDFDFPSLPGAAKAINNKHNDSAGLAMSCIDVPVRLHNVQKIIIINHADCGAYGGRANFGHDLEAELAFHKTELQLAKDALAEKYPDKEIITLFVQFDEESSLVDILTIS